MGRRILVQRRGKGTQNFRSPSHRKRGAVKYIPNNYTDVLNFKVIEFIHEGGRGTPLARIEFDDKKRSLWLPPEGVFLKDTLA